MREETEGQRRARLAIRQQVNRYLWLDPVLATRAGIHRDTVRRVLAGDIWPNRVTRAKIEVAIGWPTDRIQGVADGVEEIPPLRDAPPGDEEIDERRVAELPDDVSDEERAELLAYLVFIRNRRRDLHGE